MSVNANSLKNKLMSLKFNISSLRPQVIVVQETKMKRKGKIELKGYKIFETIRGDNGGGLMVAVLSALEPVFIFEGDCECEVLVVEVSLENVRMRVIAGYGPQECSPVIVREKYRLTIEEQVIRTYLAGHLVLIAEDSNSKLGNEMIKNDPHPMSENGKLLANMISRQNLIIINNSEHCKGGPVTRQRNVKGKEEKSCIDFIIVCRELADHFLNATIDCNQIYCLTQYTSTKGNKVLNKSDHFTIIATFQLECKGQKPVRREIFKLRDEIGLNKFNAITANHIKLRDNFKSGLSLEEACNKWYKEIDKILHGCFKKVRITDTPPKSTIDYEIHILLKDVKKLKELYTSCHEMQKPIIEIELMEAETKVAKLQGAKCKRIIEENTKNLLVDGSFRLNEVWKLKKKIFPKCRDAPFAIFDKNGKIATDYSDILDVMKEEFKFRLRNRIINPEYQELLELKEYLCKLRLEISKSSSYEMWTVKQLKSAIAKLKNNKCKDPHGHINELYKYMGADGIASLLDMMNIIKEKLLIPKNLNLSNITAIYKGKGSRQEVINLRGIFKLPITRNILDKLIINNEQDSIGNNMGQFQVGNQKD